MTRCDLHAVLEPILREWIRAACTWKEARPGDHRALTFSIDMGSAGQVVVQFWSEPLAPVQSEVMPAWLDAALDDRLVDERERRIEAIGFRCEGDAATHRREDPVRTAADIAGIAWRVVALFYDAFDYRGVQPIMANLAHEGRSMVADTYGSFTPGDVANVFLALGYHLEDPPGDSDAAGPAVIRCRKGGITTVVQFCEPAQAGDLYARVRLTADQVGAASVVHTFSGGVTLDWLKLRIQDWDAVLQESRRAGCAEPHRRRHTSPTTVTIH